MRAPSRLILSAFVPVAMSLTIGCGAIPREYEVVVSLDDPLKATSLTVDLIAVDADTGEKLADMKVKDYFDSGDAMRGSVKPYTMTFKKEDSGPKTLEMNDPRWKVWLDDGAVQLFIIASLPGSFEDKPGRLNKRRLILSLMNDQWKGDQLKIEISKGLVKCTTKRK